MLTEAKPVELIVGNMVRRTLRITREAGKELTEEDEAINPPMNRSISESSARPSPTNQSATSNTPPILKKSYSTTNIEVSLSLHKLLDQPAIDEELVISAINPSINKSLASSPKPILPRLLSKDELRVQRDVISSQLKPAIIEDLGVLLDEVKDSEFEIAKQSVQHIYAREVILTYGCSETVCAFLKDAAEFRRFEVIVCESAPIFDGHRQAVSLSSAPKPIETTLISDAAMFAMMPSVNKVIIGCHAVMANGGLIVRSGGLAIALAARHHAVPFVVLTGLHKLTPLYPFDQATFNEYHNPAELATFGLNNQIKVENPAYDYIAPDLVTLLLTNGGGHNPSYVYRLLADHYHPMDTTFRKQSNNPSNVQSLASNQPSLTRDSSTSSNQSGTHKGSKKGKRPSISSRSSTFDD